jgi:hypothetical protein
MSTFNADGSHNDNWVQLSGSTPSPVAAAGSALKLPEIHHSIGDAKAVNTLSVCPTYTDLASWPFAVDRFGFLLANADGIYAPGTANKYVRVCIDDASGGTTCDSWSPIMESTSYNFTGNAAEKRFALQRAYQVNPGTKWLYLKACREDVATTGTIMWDDFAATWQAWDY